MPFIPYKASPERRSLAGQIGRSHPDDPRRPEWRERLEALKAADDLNAWCKRAAAALPPFDPDAVAQAAEIAARIDQRLGLVREQVA